MTDLAKLGDCAWCGGEIFDSFPNRRGERFCSKHHRDASGHALRRFLERDAPASDVEEVR